MGLGKGLGCSGICAKYILFLVNFAVFACGAAILAVGIGLLVSDEIAQRMSEVTGAEGALNNSLIVATIYIMIAVGALLFVVGFFGCCGACKESQCMLTMYVILVSLLLLLQIGAVAMTFVFRGEMGEPLKTSMTDSVQEEYGRKNETTTAWDDMQFHWECCGSYDHTSYNNSYYSNATGNVVPSTCCTATVDEDGSYTIDPIDYLHCQANASSSTGDYYYEEGCHETFTGWITKNTNIIIGVLIALGAIQIISICIACCVKEQLNK